MKQREGTFRKESARKEKGFTVTANVALIGNKSTLV